MANGQTIVIKGEISGNEDLTVAGRVEGKINLANRVLTLLPGSHVTGDVSAGSVIVSGTVEGSINATVRLEIQQTAIIDGDLSAPKLRMIEGAQVNALIDMPAQDIRAVA
jgi:cytoskeletal protein CcmA (bactofilin family)